jgi:RNA polymerase sigma-70 factor, ECF subfamily
MTSLSPTPNDGGVADWGREHGPAVRGYLLAMVRCPDVADDLVQEVFYRAWQARERYRENGTARAYLFRIADRLACDFGRKSGREVQLGAEGWDRAETASRCEAPADRLVRQEASRELAAAMEALTPVQRRVLLLRYYGDLSFSAIAEIIQCPLGTALSHCHRGLLTLRKLLGKVQL